MRSQFRCVLHGSFRKHFAEIKRVHDIFTRAGIEVLAPSMSEIVSFQDGFALLESDTETDPRMIELLYLQHLKRLGADGFSYFVNPEGYIGKSASYELGIAQVSNIPCFFLEKPVDHPVYTHRNSVTRAEHLAEYIVEVGKLPGPVYRRDEARMYALWEALMVPGSVVAVGAMIEYAPEAQKTQTEREILLVKTHKWGDRYSMIGGKVRRNERLEQALKREILEESGLKARVGEHICTFDQIKNSGYYQAGTQHIFVDKVVQVESKHVTLNEEAQDFIWVPPSVALSELDIEPNARHTLELYAKLQSAV